MASLEENKALVRRWWDETNKGNLDVIDELGAPDYIDQNPPLPGMGEGSSAVRKANEALWAAFPDTVHIIEEMVAERDLVVTRLRTRHLHGRVPRHPPEQQGDRDYRHVDPPRRQRQTGGALGKRRPPEFLAADGCHPKPRTGHVGHALSGWQRWVPAYRPAAGSPEFQGATRPLRRPEATSAQHGGKL
jgi:hypothetical protein